MRRTEVQEIPGGAGDGEQQPTILRQEQENWTKRGSCPSGRGKEKKDKKEKVKTFRIHNSAKSELVPKTTEVSSKS